MSTEKSTAIIVRVTDFSETSCVVTCFTEHFGKIEGLAKGARRPKGPFEGAIDLLAVCRIVFIHKSSDSLDLLTEAKLERRFRGAVHGLPFLYSGYYVAELLREMTDTGDPHPELFAAANEALLQLESGRSWWDVILGFEASACRTLGHFPALVDCAACGRSVERGPRVPFAPLVGGVLCADCRRGQRKVISVSRPVIEELEKFAESSRSPEEQVPQGLRGELRGVMNNYIANLLGRRPRMYDYVGQ